MIGLGHLWKLYLPLISWVGFGLLLGCKLPQSVPFWLGKFLFWVGVPLSILSFLRQTDLSASVWIAPIVAWVAMLLGVGLGWLWIQAQMLLERYSPGLARRGVQWLPTKRLQPASQGSFLLAVMVGNTGYLGYPISLALVGTQYFGWAVFYDTLGSTLGAYGLGVVLASRFGSTVNQTANQTYQSQLLQALLHNPALWSFWIGLGSRSVALPPPVEQGLIAAAWAIVALSLLLLGMRLSQLRFWQNFYQATVSLSIKMVIVPLLVGLCLTQLGIVGPARLVIVLQAAMPPAFATLVIAEAYNLDRELTVTMLALGSLLLLLLLPLWLTLLPI